MKVMILQNIVSSNNVYTINKLIDTLKLQSQEVLVYFCATTESNRRWKLHETPQFSYSVLTSKQLRFMGKDLFTYFINLSIISILKTENPDWIIVGGWDQFAYQAAVLWGKLHNKRITLWSGSTSYEKSWRRTIARPLVRFLITCSTDYLAYGIRAKKYLISLGADEKKIKIHSNDINRAYFAKEAKKARKEKERLKNKFGIFAKKNFLFVGQLIERKGIMDLLESYEQVVARYPQWGLVIIGYGYLQEAIRHYLRENKLHKVRLIGAIEQYDLPRYYACCECLVLPSHEEVWGLVVNEALACGLKIITSDACGCVPDLSNEVKIDIFPTGDKVALQKSMEQICIHG